MRGPSAAAVAEGSVCVTELAKDTDAPARRGPIARQSRAPVAAGVAARLSADWVMENDTASLSSLLFRTIRQIAEGLGVIRSSEDQSNVDYHAR